MVTTIQNTQLDFDNIKNNLKTFLHLLGGSHNDEAYRN